MTYTLLPIAPASFEDIEARIRVLGPDYNNCFREHRDHGLIILLDRSEVGLVKDKMVPVQYTWLDGEPVVRKE